VGTGVAVGSTNTTFTVGTGPLWEGETVSGSLSEKHPSQRNNNIKTKQTLFFITVFRLSQQNYFYTKGHFYQDVFDF
jgi:hypothetical protein